MRILFLTQFFEPEAGLKGLPFAKTLCEWGHEVEVLTGFPNYPGGKLYPGYHIKWRQIDDIDGIKVRRVPLYPSHDGSAFRRILNYFSFAISSSIYGFFIAKKYDVIYVYHPPMTVGLSAAVINFFSHTPFVIDIQDMWPDTLQATGMLKNRILLAFVGKLCRFVYRRASHIVVQSKGFRELLIGRNVPGNKIDVIYNWCSEKKLLANEKIDLDQFKMKGHFNVVFAGNIGKAQALSTILLVAKQIEKINTKIQFIFFGEGVEVERLRHNLYEQNINNVLFFPRICMEKIGTVLIAADVLLVHLKDDPLFEITIPSKIQAYLALGKPILAAVKGEASDLVIVAQAGYSALPENVSSIVDALLRMAALPPEELTILGLNGAKFYTENLSLLVGAKKFVEIFMKVVGKRRI